MSELKVYQDKRGEWRWRLTHSNGHKLANGGEGYKNRRDLLKVVSSLFPWFRAKGKVLQRATNRTYWSLSGRDL